MSDAGEKLLSGEALKYGLTAGEVSEIVGTGNSDGDKRGHTWNTERLLSGS